MKKRGCRGRSEVQRSGSVDLNSLQRFSSESCTGNVGMPQLGRSSFIFGQELEEAALHLNGQSKLMTVLCRGLIGRRIEWFSQLWTLERLIT